MVPMTIPSSTRDRPRSAPPAWLDVPPESARRTVRAPLSWPPLRLMAAAAEPRPISVLVVDDEMVTGRIVRRMLEADPTIQVHTCFEARAATAMAAKVSPSLILQDLRMPGTSGIA